MQFSSVLVSALGGRCDFLFVVVLFGTHSHEKPRDQDPVFLSMLKALGVDVQNWRPASKPPAAAKDCPPPVIHDF